MKRVLIVLSIIVAIFLIFCTAVVVLIQFPGFQSSVTNIVNPTTVVETTTEIETTKKVVVETVETTVPLPKLSTSLSTYKYKGCIDIEYPVVEGMEDEDLQERINKKIYNNAKSIVDLYPISTSMQELSVKAKVNELNDDKLTIIYEGRVIGYTVKDGDAVSNQSANTSKPSPFSDNPSNNYQIPGFDEAFSVIPDLNAANNEIPIIDGNQSGTSQAPNTSEYYEIGPGGIITGFSRTINVDQRVFYTNTINMKTGDDIYMSQIVDPEALAKYARSSKAEIVNATEYNEKEIRNYIRKSTVTALTEVFTKADFHNTDMTYWPKSFSYVENDDLYFTVRLSSKLGNYAIIKYSLKK